VPRLTSSPARCAAIALCVAAAPAFQPTTAPVNADLRAWLDQLNAPDPTDRAAAEAHLAAAGCRAIATLSAAQNDPRPEVAIRGRRALRRIRLFELRTPPFEALALADRYLSTEDPAARAAIVQQIAQLRPMPVDVLARLVTLESDASLRSQLLAVASRPYRQAVPRLVAEGDVDGVGLLLEQAAVEMPSVGAPDAAIEQFLTGRSDGAAARWRAELANGKPDDQLLAARMLCQLDRVAGRSADALDMARRSHDPGLTLDCAIDAGDWSTAADAATDCWPGPAAAAVRAGLLSLAGRPAGPDVDAAITAPDGLAPGKLHLLLGHVEQGLNLLSADPTAGGDPVAAFRLRLARGEYDQALALADRFAHDPKLGPPLTVLRDDLNRLLGELPTPPTATSTAPSPDASPWAQAVADLSRRRYAAAAAELAPGDVDPDHIDWWYVRGFALTAAGDAAAGRALMRAAALAPLADTARRAWLADRLAEAGLTAAADQQRALAAAVADPTQDAVPVLNLQLAREASAAAAHDDPAASAAADRVWLLSFWPGQAWDGPAAYLTVPADLHLARARLARSRDDWPTALRELDAYRTFLPTSPDVPLEWVPLLDAHGDHAAADQVFAVAYDAADAAAARHPRSPYLHNQAAWLAACCCRRLNAALAHARAAVALSPDDWQYADTLAECRFRAGDRSGAVELERRAAAMPAADLAYLARQLDRFAKAAVPSMTRPAEAPG
jgi:hypothetical protein